MQVSDCHDSVREVRSPSHKCILTLCIEDKLPIVFRTVAARSTWHCESCPLSQSSSDVCKYFRPIHWIPWILLEPLKNRAIIVLHSSILNDSSLGDTRAVLQFSRSEHHTCQLSRVSCANQASPTNAVQDAFGPILVEVLCTTPHIYEQKTAQTMATSRTCLSTSR